MLRQLVHDALPTPSIAVAHCCFTSSSTVSPRRRPLAGCANWHWCRARAAAAGGAASLDYAPRPDAAQSAHLRSPDMGDILLFSSWVSCSHSLLPRVASAHRRLLCRRARHSRPRLRCLCLGSEELHGLSSEMQICSWYCLVWLWTGCCHCSETPCQNVRLRYMVIRVFLPRSVFSFSATDVEIDFFLFIFNTLKIYFNFELSFFFLTDAWTSGKFFQKNPFFFSFDRPQWLWKRS